MHACVSNDGNAVIEQTLAESSIQAVGIKVRVRWNEAKYDSAEFRSTHEFERWTVADNLSGISGQFNSSVDHRRKFHPAQSLKRNPQFQCIKAAAGEQGSRHQIRDAFVFVVLGVEIVGVQLDRIEVPSIPK